MKVYPSIPKKIISDRPFYCFDKLDGSQIRVEWEPKKGFHKFGTRHRLLDEREIPLGEAVPLILEQGQILEKIFLKQKFPQVTCYFEFWGYNSFAGQHEDEEHYTTLFDVSVYKKGFIGPREFLKLFEGCVRIPKMVYYGNITDDVVLWIRKGLLGEVTFEGVVCKAQEGRQIKMFKVKSQAWLDKLYAYCDGDERLFEQLS